MSTLLLADGHNLLFRSFYGIPARIVGRSGQKLNAVLGVIGMLLRVARAEGPTGALVVFDSETGSFRDRETPSYKASRVRDFSAVAADDNPFAQLAPLKSALDSLGWRYCEIDDVEADDVIAAYSRSVAPGDRIVVVSGDADLLQLVSPAVTVIAGRDRLYTPSTVVQKYGVPPARLPLLKALAGDVSDNISGVHGIGPKTARSLLQQYHTLDDLFFHLDDLSARNRRLLEGARPDVEAALRLVSLERDVPLPYSSEELAIPPCEAIATMDVLRRADLI